MNFNSKYGKGLGLKMNKKWQMGLWQSGLKQSGIMGIFSLQRLAVSLLMAVALSWAGDEFELPLSGAGLAQWQVQGEYFGTIAGGGNLGAWLVAHDNNKYTVVFLPGGLLTLPGQPYGGWDRTGWARNANSASATLSGTAYSATTTSGYTTTTITGAGEAKVMMGTIKNGAAFTLNRVIRHSPTYRLRPKAEWGMAKLLFDSATGAQDQTLWNRYFQNSPALNRGFLDRGMRTNEKLGSGFLHVEFQGSFDPAYDGQGRANSGVYLQSHYEAQVLDSFGEDPLIDGYGSVYSVKAPPVNAALPPCTWHTYDIYFTQRSSGTDKDSAGAATMTVYANGVLTQQTTKVLGVTPAGINGDLLQMDALYLQDHGNNVAYNNIWFIPNATEQTLPYSTLIGGVSSIGKYTITPKAAISTNDILKSFTHYNLTGRMSSNVKNESPAFLYNNSKIILSK